MSKLVIVFGFCPKIGIWTPKTEGDALFISFHTTFESHVILVPLFNFKRYLIIYVPVVQYNSEYVNPLPSLSKADCSESVG